MKQNIKKILREGLILEQRIKFDIPIPEDIQQIKDVFKRNGHKLYVVGGAVRDAVLGKSPKDYDLATDAVPDKVEEMMKAAGLKTLPTGKAFGVINVFTSEGEYELATFREDLSGGRRPDAVSFTNIEGDVKRRDLTINALFYDIDTHEIVDLVGGLEDIKNGVVRTVGSAEDRFSEDRLRILRACRFAGRFGSKLDPETDAALQKDASLEGISGERIRDEFIKGLKSAKSTKVFLEMIDKYGLFKWIFKGLNVDLSLLGTLNRNEDDYIVLIARLLKNNTIDSIRKKLNELKYPDDEIKTIAFLVGLLRLDIETVIPLKKAQKHTKVSSDQIRNFGGNEGISSQLLDAFEAFELTVSGPEVMDKTGLKPGPELGKEIERIEIENFKKLIHEDLMYGYIVDGKKVKITEEEYKQRIGEGLIMTHSSEKTKEILERWMGEFFTVLANSEVLFVIPKDKSKDKIDWLFRFMDNMGYFSTGYYDNNGTSLGKTIKNDNYTGLRFEAKFDIEIERH